MNILTRYINEGNKRREQYAYNLINLFEYTILGVIDLGKLTEDEKMIWQIKADELRDEIAELIMKGLKK